MARNLMRACAVAAVCLLVSEFGRAQSPGQITFGTPDGTGGHTLWRINAEAGAVPENLSVRLDSVAVYPGRHDGPIMVSPDGAWYAFYSERFDSNSQGWAGLTIARADLQFIETIRADGATIHGEWGQAAAGGNAVVYVDGGGPHTQDIFVVERQAPGWAAPRCLTVASPYAWNYWPVLASDGSRVLFDAGNSSFPSARVCEVRLDGTNFRVLASIDSTPPGYTPSPAVHSGAYAPDGSIVFEAEWGGAERLWRLPAAGGVPQLIDGSMTNDNSPNLLPDGRIVSLWLGSTTGVGLHEIKLMDPSGATFVMLTDTSSPFPEVEDGGLGCGPSYKPLVVHEPTDMPRGHALAQNFPNPFNPSTIIHFSVVNTGIARLQIFDLLGREIATLINQELAVGSYDVRWDPGNQSAGVYFYRLVAGDISETKKMVLLK